MLCWLLGRLAVCALLEAAFYLKECGLRLWQSDVEALVEDDRAPILLRSPFGVLGRIDVLYAKIEVAPHVVIVLTREEGGAHNVGETGDLSPSEKAVSE